MNYKLSNNIQTTNIFCMKPDIDTIIFIQFEKDVVLNGLMVDRIKLSSI
jgi:hypothetical protein